MVEWVEPRQYDRWTPPKIKRLPKKAEERKPKKPEEPGKTTTRTTPPQKARPHGGKAGEIGPGRPPQKNPAGGNLEILGPEKPRSPLPGDPQLPPGSHPPMAIGVGPRGRRGRQPASPPSGGSRPQGGPSRAEILGNSERIQRDLGDMVQEAMGRGGKGGRAQLPVGSVPELDARGRAILTGEIVDYISAPVPGKGLDIRSRTAEMPSIKALPSVDTTPTGPISLSRTSELPSITQPIPVRRGVTQRAEPFGQTSMFDVGPHRQYAEENLSQANTERIERISQTPHGMQPGRQVASLSARPYFPKVKKGEESQGVLFQPGRYK